MMFKFQKFILSLLKSLYGTFIQEKIIFLYICKWLIIALLLSCCIGSVSALFLLSLEWATQIRENHRFIIIFLPLGGCVVGFLYHFWGKKVEAGNSLLLETIQAPQQTIPFLMAPLIYIGTIVTHILGGSAGREGTALQMAGAIADSFSQPLKLALEERKILLIAAVAGGFGSVFGTPLAGALFGLEFSRIGNIRYHAIFPAFITSILSNEITKLWHVQHTIYTVHAIPELSFILILYACIAGLCFGIGAILFSTTQHTLSTLFKSYISYPPFRPLVGGIIIALGVGLIGTRYIGLGIPVIIQAFEQPLPISDFFLKLIFTGITLSSGFKGGEVTPLFFIGATLGSALSWIIPLPISLLAAMGFVAVFAGATHTPLACILMGIELFGGSSGIYLALACITAYLISGHTGIYPKQIIDSPKHPSWETQTGKYLNDL